MLHIKRQDESLFLYETTTDVKVSQVIEQVVRIQNDRIRMLDITKGLSATSEYFLISAHLNVFNLSE